MILRHSFTPLDNDRLAHLCGALDEHLRTIDTFLEMGKARDVEDLLRRQDRAGGMPWVNTTAADRDGNVFEVLHWEYDGFNYAEVESRKQELEPRFAAIDWDDAAARILKQKDQWHHLDFFAQSDWKCNYFGIVKERFKMVIWE